ncbi:MAG: S8 family serine peptidase [Kiritimatiellales bacterium]|nr:S8 family serine peptidase [Kiritimatiellales bacterium]
MGHIVGRKWIGMLLCGGCVGAVFASPPRYVDGEVLIQLKAGKSRQATATERTQARRTFSRLSQSAGRTIQLVKDRSRTTEELIALLRSNPDVEAVSPNYLKRVSALPRIPDDLQFGKQWGLYNTGQAVAGTTGTADADIDFPEARRLMMDSPPEVVVAVIDTGVDYTHPDLKGAMWVNTGEIAGNGVDDDGNGFVDDIYGYDFAGDIYTDPATDEDVNDGADGDPMDVDLEPGHGTHVAGDAAATHDNALGISGTGRLKIMALKASDDGVNLADSDTIAAMEYVLEMKARGVNIVAVNASYGGTGYNALEALAIQQLRNAGIVLCAAAGNETVDNDSIPQYPGSHNLDNIVSVAATDPSDQLASFSNYGLTSVDLGVPGVNILSCLPAHIGAEALVTSGSQTFGASGFSFSGLTVSGGVSAVFYDCGLGYPADFPSAVAGNIALIERGELYFTEKVANAMNAGALAAVVYNRDGEAGEVQGTLMRPHGWIPTVGIDRADGLLLKALSGQSMTVINRYSEVNGYVFLSGTSMATPIVAGCIGTLAQHFPDDTPASRIGRLLANVDAVPALTAVCASGGRLNLAKSLDSDSDELPDWWELRYAPNLNTMNGGSNLDGDRVTDLGEYRTQTLPNQSSSQWAVRLDSQPASENSLQLRWSSHAGCSYRVLASDNLLSNGFSTVTGLLPATPPINEWSVSPANAPTHFFKIELIWE